MKQILSKRRVTDTHWVGNGFPAHTAGLLVMHGEVMVGADVAGSASVRHLRNIAPFGLPLAGGFFGVYG